jgi:hypothetical protein
MSDDDQPPAARSQLPQVPQRTSRINKTARTDTTSGIEETTAKASAGGLRRETGSGGNALARHEARHVL